MTDLHETAKNGLTKCLELIKQGAILTVDP